MEMYSMCNLIIYGVRETMLVNIRTAEDPLRLWTSSGETVILCIRSEWVKAATAARTRFVLFRLSHQPSGWSCFFLVPLTA